jgi:hypothetical protein
VDLLIHEFGFKEFFTLATLIKMLLELHPDIAAISAKNIRNNEGQFFQTVCFHKKQLFSVVPSSFFF